jgi:hypothetical protein
MQFGRGLAWIGGVAVIGVGALIYFGLDGTERKEAPPEVLGTRGPEAADSSSPAGAGTRESRLVAAREKDRRAARGHLDRGADAPAGEASPYEEGSSRAADERLGTEGRTAAGARAPRPGTASSGTRAGEGTGDRPESDADRAAIDAFLRAASEAAGRDAAPRDDRVASETSGERDDGGDRGRGDEDDRGRGDEDDRGRGDEDDRARGDEDDDDKGRGGVSDPMLKGVSVGSPVMMTCANEPWICDFFSMAFSLPGAIPVVSDGTEAVQLPVAGGPDIVWIRTGSGVMEVPTENLTNAGQLAALVGQLAPRP